LHPIDRDELHAARLASLLWQWTATEDTGRSAV